MNLPPLRAFPPRATAKMASISISFATAAYAIVPLLLILTKPTTATHTPRIINDTNLITIGLIPFNLDDFSLLPTA